jgi:hypothetical protein
MEKIRIKFINCYGIPKLKTVLDFGKDKNNKSINAHLIYAPNGTMKTSFADTIKDIQNGVSTMDFYYPNRNTIRELNEVLSDEAERELRKEDVLVIDSYDEQYKSDKVSTLLANKELKADYDKIYESIITKLNNLLAKVKSEAGYKSEIDEILTSDFGFSKDKIFDCLNSIVTRYEDFDGTSLNKLKYAKVFTKDTNRIFESDSFKLLIKEYIEAYERLLIGNPVFKKDFNHTSADTVFTNMSKNGFFKANHKVVLDGTTDELDEKEFKQKIDDAKKMILNEPEMMSKFNNLDSLFSNAGTREFRDLLLNNKNLIVELNDIEELKRRLWVTYLFENKDILQDVLLTYKIGKTELDSIAEKASKERTVWDTVINQFNERFSNMPFSLKVKNQEDVILKGSIATICFKYNNRDEEKEITEETLLKRLSNGERRALYLLNILFEIKAREIDKHEILLIMDDIADSFDYRNKYAIIEYIKEIVENGLFKVIILTHNFDFYRTVACRIDLKSTSHFTIKSDTEIMLEKGEYHENVFGKWKSHIYTENVFFVASIPFIRNIIEYTKGTNCCEYRTLTSLLHFKEYTKSILSANLKKIYGENWGADESKFTQKDETPVIDIVLGQAERIYSKECNQIKIENKIVMSIAIRLLAEQYMESRIADKELIRSIERNQTRELRNLVQFGDTEDENKRKEVIEKVLIITSENIHLNSFMYEPIVDISLSELEELYRDVKAL